MSNALKITIDGEQYREWRCGRCKNYIIFECDTIGKLAHRCPKCGLMNKETFTMLDTNANRIKMKKYLVKPIVSQPEGGEK